MMAFLCGLFLLGAILPGCPEPADQRVYNGYIEGEFVLVAPREQGRIAEVKVKEGDEVKAGDMLFRLEDDHLRLEVVEAQSRVAQAKSLLGDLELGKRREEIAVSQAELDQARASLADADIALRRQAELHRKGVVSRSILDAAQAVRDQAAARVASIARRIEVERMPARIDAIAAARGNVEAAEAALGRTKWRLGQLAVAAPAAGIIQEVLRRPGEMAGPDAAVLSLLPPENRIVRFFVPEPERSKVAPGTELSLACDRCPQGLTARVRFVSTKAEYTPPIIYSVESRQKLVFAVEARPEGPALALTPGQPVDIRILGPSK